MITQEELVRLANKWPIDWKPKYRRPICANCGVTMAVMWHCWLNEGGYKKEIHLCKKCGNQYNL
jgi:RNase P subunit RPR2